MNGRPAKRDPTEWSAAKPEHIPEPTYWPAVMALGVSVTAMGLDMILPVFIVGLLVMVVGWIGWIGALTEHG